MESGLRLHNLLGRRLCKLTGQPPSEKFAARYTLAHLSGLEPLDADHEANNCPLADF